MTFKGETAVDMASSEEAFSLLGCTLKEKKHSSQVELPFIPNYLQNPPFPYGDTAHDQDSKSEGGYLEHQNCPTSPINSSKGGISANPLIIKVRVHKSEDTDFIEVEISDLTYQTLLESCAEELEIDSGSIAKIRKLPDILVRKDRDVQRMNMGQELEVVLK